MINALNNFNQALQQSAQQLQQQNSGGEAAQPQAVTPLAAAQPVVDTSAQRRAAIDDKIGYLRTKVERQRQNVAKAEERLNQAISSRSSTITLSRTVDIERTTLQNYERQLSQLEAQRAGM